MPIYDIVPPQKKEPERQLEPKKDIKRVPNEPKIEFDNKPSKRKSFNLLSAIFISVFSVLVIIFVLNFDFSQLKNFLKLAIGEGEMKKNFYSVKCQGDWQIPENIVGMPEVSKDGSIDSFSSENSSIYKVGGANIICDKFKELPMANEEPKENPCGENNSQCELHSPKIYLSFAMDEASPGQTSYNIKRNIANKALNASKGSLMIKDDPSNSDLDAKIIIWYSLDDGKTWYSLEKITTMPISNYLNGDYISFDAPFLKSWQDVQSLKIKFEGVVGGEENIIAYLDSIWVGVEPAKKGSDLKEKIFSMFRGEVKKVSSEKLELTQEQFEYNIPADGKIIATVNNQNKEITGIFRIKIFSENNNLVSIFDIASGDFSKTEGYDVPLPEAGKIKRSLFLENKEENTMAIEVKKNWGKAKISIDYIPLGADENNKKEELTLDNLELNFSPSSISIENAQFLGEAVFDIKQGSEKEINFSNEKAGNIIIDLSEKDSSGVGALLIYLDDRGIGILEGGYPEGRIEILNNVLPGEHKLLIKNVDSIWDDNKGERTIGVYLK